MVLLLTIVRRAVVHLACPLLFITASCLAQSDERMREEFPDFRYVRVPPFSIATDESPAEVNRVVRSLAELHRQFVVHFAPLLHDQTATREIQVVFFGREEAFREYAQRVAPELVDSAGFYSPSEQRLALLNQLGSTRYTRLEQQLARRQHEPTLHHDAPAQQHLAAWRSDANREAQCMTARLIRHVGAHQLFHSYRIHSASGIEPTWLTEGLAGYCEPEQIGQYHATLAARLAHFREAGTLLPLDELLNHRDPAGFFALGSDRAEAAYAQSWALVYLLMQDDSREHFFRLLEFYRAAGDAETEPLQTVTQQLQTDLPHLEQRWRSFLNRL